MQPGPTADPQAAASPSAQRLQSELRRLYLPLAPVPGEREAASASLIDAHGQTRAMVLELTRPADWEPLVAVWRGVQTELEWPAPGIAVSGVDGLQLWFSLDRPEPLARAHALLESLRVRFLSEVAAKRVRLWPCGAGSTAEATPARHARGVPAQDESSGHWSAFVARDLASVFGDTPWLDEPPSQEGQATLLRSLTSITPPLVDTAFASTGPVARETPAAAVHPAARDETGADSPLAPVAIAGDPPDDPRRFLLQVMNDTSAPLALRIEAAKALLPRREAVDGSGP